VIVMVAIATSPTAAQASVGVGIQEDPISLQKAALPGETYALPPVHVADTGTQAESIVVKVERISHGNGRAVPGSWIHIGNPQLHLSAHQEIRVPLQLKVPDDAKPGRYLSDIVAIGSAAISSSGTNFGAAAATKIEFKILPGPGRGLLPSIPLFVWVLFAALLLWLFVAISTRFYALKISITRKTADRDGAESQGESSV
jgi:hypothetical protein